MQLPKAEILLRQSWDMFRKKLKSLLLIQLVPFAAGGIIALILGSAGMLDSPEPKVNNPGSLILLIAVGVIAFALQLWSQIASIIAIDTPAQIGFKELFIRARPLILPYLGVALLAAIIIIGGFVLLIVPGIIFAFWYSQSMYAVILENKRGMIALRASKAYVRGNIGQLFSRYAVLGLAALVIYAVPNWILTAAGLKDLGGIYGALVSFVFSPVAAIYAYLIYRALRDAKSANVV